MPYKLNIPGWMKEPNLRALESLAVEVPHNGVVIEIGTFLGRSTWTWCKSVHPSVCVIAVDQFEWSPAHGAHDMEDDYYDGSASIEDMFRANVADCKNVTIFKSNSLAFKPQTKADLIFIDAGHKLLPGVALDLGYYLSFVKPGGIFCGDDYSSGHPDVRQSVDTLSAAIRKPVHVRGTKIWTLVVD
jgi:predicted O-methyltransferase YrrM